MSFDKSVPKEKKLKKITKERLKNIGLYYLERFESSVQNLRNVLKRRVSRYAFQNPDFDVRQADLWIEEILSEFEKAGYINDERYADMKVRDYLAAGKSARYIKTKLKSKGIEENTLDVLIDAQNYDGKEAALKFALKKRIGPYRKTDREAFRQKDMACLMRAGFNYDDVCDILDMKGEEQ